MARLDEIHRLVEAEMAGLPVETHDCSEGLPLQAVGFGAAEVNAAIDCMVTTWVTMGRRVRAFEAQWAEYCRASHGIMCNSGSSANLLMLAALLETGRLQRGDEVLVPAVGWSTSLFPIAQVGLVPVLVDIDDTLCIDVAAAARAMGPRTKAALPVHLLGQPADVVGLEALGLLVAEDACAAPGAERDGRRAGSMGVAGTFSFFYSHHLTTVEGGIVVCRDEELANAARSCRAHGWVRERTDKADLVAASPEIDERFLFVSAGWNLRPTEMAGAMGSEQLKRLPAWIERRRQNHADWCELLAETNGVRVFPEPAGHVHTAFAFPLLLEGTLDRASVMAHLESRGIQTRPISGSNLARQPAFERVPGARVAGSLEMADRIHTHGLFVGSSHAFGRGHGLLLREALEEAING